MRLQTETDAQDMAQAKKDRDAYYMVMLHDDFETGVAIEHKYGLYGYPPEMVSAGLTAAAQGKDIEDALAGYVARELIDGSRHSPK